MQSQESQPLISRDVQKGPDLVFCEVISFLTQVAASLVCIAQIVSIGKGHASFPSVIVLR